MASVTLDLIDGLASAKAFKGACRVATTANISLSGEQTIDGIAVVEDDRVLVKNQTSSVDNGIYVASTGDWRRAADFGAANDFGAGTLVFVNLGTVGGGYLFRQTAVDPEIDVDDITFSVLTYSATVQVSPTITTPAISGGTITDTTITLKQAAAPAPTAEGDMRWDTDDDCIVVGDGATQKIFRAESALGINTGFLSGLTLSNNGTDATNDIDIAAGTARDSTDVDNMVLSAALTKRLDAAWAVGTGNGGLDTGSIANTTYHVYLIKRPDTGVVDAIFSTSASAPTLPTNYTLYRRIGAILRESSAIEPFTQYGDLFRLVAPEIDVAATNPGTSAVTAALSVPLGISVRAQIVAGINTTTVTTSFRMLVTALAETDTAPAVGTKSIAFVSAATGASDMAGSLEIPTDTSAQVRYRLSASDGNTVARITTFGWIDTRGRI